MLINYTLDKKTIMISIYIDKFLLVSNCLAILNILKKKLSQKYSIKDLGEVQTIIR